MNKRQRLCLVDWMLVPLFVGLVITGIGLHFAGHGGQTDMAWHIWTIAHILFSQLFAVFAVWHIRLHWSWYESLFSASRGKKSLLTIVISLLFVVLSATGVVLLFIKGANSHVGLWHWGIGLAAVLLFSGHILKRWRVLRQLKMNN